MRSVLALKVVARFQLQADQAPGKRKEVKQLTKPINAPKGIDRATVRENAYTEVLEEGVEPDRRDIRPSDVFQPKPVNLNVVNYARKGWPGEDKDYTDMQKAIRKQIPKDKGYATVSNLSQYLIETDGGGGTKPVGK